MSQVIVVTGGAGGIGSAVCRALAQDGLKVVIADFNETGAHQLALEIAREGATLSPSRWSSKSLPKPRGT